MANVAGQRLGVKLRVFAASLKADERSELSHLAALAELGISVSTLLDNSLALQAQLQRENRTFTALSNVMKTRHDTVKNVISNIR